MIVRKTVFQLLLLLVLAAQASFGVDNLKLNQKLDYSSDSQDGPLITGDHIQEGAVHGKPNYVFMFGEG